MASASFTDALHRQSSISVTAREYFTDSSNTINNKSDLVLVVADKKYFCHRLLLSIVSPVFMRMFEGQFKEHDQHELVLEGKNSESILELLKCIYPQFDGNITDNNVDDFLQLADEYMIEYLKETCRNILIEQLDVFKYVLLPTQEKLEQVHVHVRVFIDCPCVCVCVCSIAFSHRES
jgi:hypothetical protein